MNYHIKAIVLLAGIIFAIGCNGPVSTHAYTHPTLPNAEAHSLKRDGEIWMELIVPHSDTDGQWEVNFEETTPNGFQVIEGKQFTQFKWKISPEKVTFFGKPGYNLNLKNTQNLHHVTITVRPNYSVILESVGGAIR